MIENSRTGALATQKGAVYMLGQGVDKHGGPLGAGNGRAAR